MDRNAGEQRSLVVTRCGHGMTGRVWLVAEQRATRVRSVRLPRPVDRGTDASGQTRGEATRRTGLIERWACPVSHDRTRPVVKTLSRPFLYSDRTPRVTRPVSSSSASGHVVSNPNQWRSNAEACLISLIGASGHSSA
jgi:hypothetical protein